MTEKKQISLSPAQINEQLQAVLNRTAAAENYRLEDETVKTCADGAHLYVAAVEGVLNLFDAALESASARFKTYDSQALHEVELFGKGFAGSNAFLEGDVQGNIAASLLLSLGGRRSTTRQQGSGGDCRRSHCGCL